MTGGTGRLQAQIAAYVESRTGLAFSGVQERRLRQAVAKTMASVGTADRVAPDLVSDEVFGRLCEALTVQESYFFREPGKLSVIKERVLAGARGRRTPLRVWSAGCAGGEEAYTLAALLTEAGLAGRYRILGTDLSAAAIETARHGSYTRWSVRGLGEAALAGLFEAKGKRYRVRDRYRENVTFEQHNILDARPSGWGSFDLVLCRNVLIYFSPEAARTAIIALTDALAPGGWLILGVSDPLADGLPGLETVLTEHGVAYRRRSDEAVEGTAGSPAPALVAESLPVPGAASVPDTDSAHRGGRRRGTRVGAAYRTARRDARAAAVTGPAPAAVTAPASGPAAAAVTALASGLASAPVAGLVSAPVAGPGPAAASVGSGTDEVFAAAEQALLEARPDEAERLTRTVLDDAPRERRARLLLVQSLAEQGRMREAVAAAEHAVSLFPDDFEVRHLHAVVLLERGNAADAAVAARHAVYLHPGFPPAHIVLGRAHELLGDEAAARRAHRNGHRLLAEAVGQ